MTKIETLRGRFSWIVGLLRTFHFIFQLLFLPQQHQNCFSHTAHPSRRHPRLCPWHFPRLQLSRKRASGITREWEASEADYWSDSSAWKRMGIRVATWRHLKLESTPIICFRYHRQEPGWSATRQNHRRPVQVSFHRHQYPDRTFFQCRHTRLTWWSSTHTLCYRVSRQRLVHLTRSPDSSLIRPRRHHIRRQLLALCRLMLPKRLPRVVSCSNCNITSHPWEATPCLNTQSPRWNWWEVQSISHIWWEARPLS